MEAEGKRLSSRKLRLYEDYRSGKLSKEQYRREYESTASRILEIEKRIPELKDEVIQINFSNCLKVFNTTAEGNQPK